MSILFAGGEDESIDVLGGFSHTTAGRFRAGKARLALRASGAGLQHSFAGALAAYLAAQPAGDKDFWYGFQFRGGGGFITGLDCFYMYDTAGIAFMKITGDLSAGGMTLWTKNAIGAMVNYPASNIPQPGVPTEITFRVKVHNTLGQIVWYYNRAFWFGTPVGDTTHWCGGGTSPGKARMLCPNSNGDADYSEFIATSADDPRVGLDLQTLEVTADGAVTTWAGGFASIAELAEDPTTLLQTAAAATDWVGVVRDLTALTGSQIVRAIVLSGKYRTSVGAPQNVHGLLRIGGVMYPAAMQLVDAVASLRQFIYATSPATGLTLAELEVNNLQAGMRAAA